MHKRHIHIVKNTSLILIIAVVISVLVACPGVTPYSPETLDAPQHEDGQSAEDHYKIGILNGPVYEIKHLFTNNTWKVQNVHNHPFDIKFLQSTHANEWTMANELADQNVNILWGTDHTVGDDIIALAEEHPQQIFGSIDYVYNTPPQNVVSVIFDDHDGAFLMGLIAGSTTKTDLVGFLGADRRTQRSRFEFGFRAGVKTANPNAHVLLHYTETFERPDVGQTYGAALFDQGADVVFHVAGQAGEGVVTEALNREGVWVMGVNEEETVYGDDVLLASMIKRVDRAVLDISHVAASGESVGGQVKKYGLENGGIEIVANEAHLSDQARDLIDEYRQLIVDNQFEVPQNAEQFVKYIDQLK